ncbi:MAG: hypothetical protein K6G55_06595 [Selenomonadaceae bacterium]|nr:hypothetical protein [Selenomonadaceae bacterium]
MKVRGLGNEIYFDEIFVSKAANNHGECKFKQRIDKDDMSKYQSAVGRTINVESDDGRQIFSGEIDDVIVEQTYQGCCAEVTAHSLSVKEDEKPETRIFQNPEKKFIEFLNQGRLNLKNCTLTLDEKLAAKTCKEIILQNDETNFEFIKRMAAWQGLRVWINDISAGTCKIKIADCADKSLNSVADENVIRLRLRRRGNIQVAELIGNKYFDLGRVLKLNGVNFVIVAQKIYQQNGVDRIYFELEELKSSEPKDFPKTAPVKLRQPKSRKLKTIKIWGDSAYSLT